MQHDASRIPDRLAVERRDDPRNVLHVRVRCGDVELAVERIARADCETLLRLVSVRHRRHICLRACVRRCRVVDAREAHGQTNRASRVQDCCRPTRTMAHAARHASQRIRAAELEAI